MNFKILFRLSLSGLLFLLILSQMDHQILMKWWQSDHAPEAPLFILSTLLVIGQIYFLNLRWHAYLNCGIVKIPFKTSVLTNIAGYFANILFINTIGGMIAKSGLAVRHGIDLTHAVIATCLDRFMTLFALMMLSAVGLPFLIHAVDRKILGVLCLILLGFAATVFVLLWFYRSGLWDRNEREGRHAQMLKTLTKFFTNRQMILSTSIHSLIAQALFIASVYALSLGIHGPEGKTLEFLALLPILALISSLPVGFGGWGIRESAFVYGLGLIGYSMEQSFLLSIQVGLVGLIAPLIYGLPYLLRNDLRDFLGTNKPAGKYS